MLDALRTQWSTRVVGYDLHTQVDAFNRIVLWLGRLGVTHPRGAPIPSESRRSLRAEPHLPASGWSIATILVLALVLAATVWWVWRRRHRPRKSDALPASARGAVRLYRALDQALARRGYPRPAAATPLEHLAALEHADFAGADVVREVTLAYLGARWGTRPLAPDEHARLRAAVGRIAAGAPRIDPPAPAERAS